MKELPATLLLAPPGFETLATRIWNATEDAFLADASLAALFLLLLSGILTWLLVVRHGNAYPDPSSEPRPGRREGLGRAPGQGPRAGRLGLPGSGGRWSRWGCWRCWRRRVGSRCRPPTARGPPPTSRSTCSPPSAWPTATSTSPTSWPGPLAAVPCPAPARADRAAGRRAAAQPHDPLLPLLLAGPAAGGWVGAKLAMAAMAGLLAALLLWTAVRRFAVPLRTATLAAAVFALSPPLAVYGSQVYPELPAALAVLAAVAALVGPGPARGGATQVPAGVGATLVVGGRGGVAVVGGQVRAGGGGTGDGRVLGAGPAGRGRRALVLAGSLVVAGIVFLVLHRWWYGGWTPYAAGDFVGGELSVVGTEPDYLGRSRRLLGLLVDRGFGLAAWQPAGCWPSPRWP